ncbi:MAG: hypothetical protein CL489_15330 [Acidobacteria bacterium]|nr:hypothetical protein [Acidobacteriota bacterium]MBF85827.1 hypothetical protein [Acidobacteriota bacterium]MCH2277695.1 endolytic transglycosylase MltG [Vicinamibacterales bacterium]|tara:strand:+ start:6519 stop:7553 length:1035 start_codon:yes stop_codon:yes gene_type:complete
MTLRRLGFLALAALLAALIVAGVTATRLVARWEAPFHGYSTADVFVEIAPGSSALAIAHQLVGSGVVQDLWAWRYALWKTSLGRELKAGEYRFNRPLSALEVIDKIAQGKVHLRPITFPEGLTISAMALIFGQSSFGTTAAFLEASRRVEMIVALDPEASSLEGYLFPDTYSLPRTATADDLAETMVARFKVVFGESLRRQAAETGLSVPEVVTLASLVERETALAEERPLIAAVFRNRLSMGMALQCDPTVIYALDRAGLYDGNLTRANLTFDSRYNTYRYSGLPPGPIAAPGLPSLEAAVQPADVGYLYFVSRNDGSHVFASSLREHNRNVREYQRRFFRGQ